MAESIVKFILGKIADATVQELLHLCGVDKQVKLVRDELGWIQAFLKDADRKNNNGDERQRHWIKEIREVAYDIEDTIDKACLLGIEMENPKKRPSKMEAFKRIFKSPKAQHELGVEIKEILKRIEKISENRVKYGTDNLGEGSGGQIELPVKPLLIPNFDDPDVVGFEHDRYNIVNKLLDDNTGRRCIVSIVGPGGLGKTTLARKAYNSPGVKKNFNLRILITISQKFKLVDILRKLVEEIRGRPINEDEQGQKEDYFHVKLYEYLREKKYLVVLDDVWTDKLWFQIKEAFPDTKNGSRVLMTTRFLDVAKSADPTSEPYKLPYLTEKPSLDLLLKKALPNQEPEKGYPDNLCDLAKEFIKKCGGLPLALVLLGGLLSKQTPDVHSWRKVLKRMDWLDDASKVLSTSYDDLPFALKSCFMYFALLPEDHIINARSLIRMWVAEGFIPHNDDSERTLEHIAENFLEDLVQRSMVQVLRTRSALDHSIQWCYMHDLLHDIAIKKAKEDSFLTVSSNPDDQRGCSGARRVAHHGNCNELMKDTIPNLRSLFCFKEVPNLSRHRQLKILSHMQKGLLSERRRYEVSTSLRYMQLNKGHYSIHFVGSKIMSFLQTIDVRLAWSVDLPESIWYIKTLRHVLLPYTQKTLGPPPLVHMRNLQTLVGVTTVLSWTEGLPNLPCLRELDITVEDEFPWELLLTFLGTLKHLESLTILRLQPEQKNVISNAFKNVKFERDTRIP
ncbi:Disease resistance protein (CC-NBS-LRR class) family [Rhynchospora pubera]|uniref:Disease resistance protein (CC-NBS-LRR class) family n=1 Tax=Rhynchospora pubera TaxID=906938 RepID=A0AAV8GEW3_9POAL|nr:Disease resistance protein (CC-NBS-LRR class) family [Rhynchospora pubera]